MQAKNPERKLTNQQLHTLKLLYKFRFLTPQLLASYKGISRIATNKALNTLVAYNLVGRRYKPSYKLLGKGARYYLAPKGLIYLRDAIGLNEVVLHAYYKNKSVTEEFIDHHLIVLQQYLKVEAEYPGTFHIFSKYELHDNEDLPEIKPDLYLLAVEQAQDQPNHYLLYVYEDTQLFVIKKQLKAIIERYELEDAKDVSIQLLLKNGNQVTAIKQFVEEKQDAYDLEFEIMVQPYTSQLAL